METHTKTQKPSNGQLIYVPHKDTIRLLEVYVKRSLSLNDGTLGDKRAGGKEKWVTNPRKLRRHSSDTCLHLADEPNDGEIGKFFPVPTADQPETRPEESEKPVKKSKKNKKPSLWKSFLGIFSRKVTEEKDEEQDSPPEIPESPSAAEASDTVTTCLPTIRVNPQKRKSTRRKSLRRRFSERRQSVKKPIDFNHADITRVEAVSVEPTYRYYEKVSEELEKIIHEVQEKEEPLSDEDVIDRIIALTKEEGDAIDYKLKDNPTLSNFFKGMSYSSFQKLADAYLETEASPTHNPPTVLPTAPELVKLAFTLDFTARIVGLSKQHIGHITGLGNRYLHDRFEYQQACSDHPGSDSDD
ncbi:apoptosis facilitator Bcl-2-like protein 14 [Cebidichthys violaceus]|uniref:apoptosis facilitator Bcl-2-like protein 14 n=1 Tax=Cebidichthys violaceus TaxID=271503 RepID=UPI0035CA46CD